MRLLAEAPCEQVIDMLGDVTAPAVADPDEHGKLAHLLARLRVRADERAEQFQGALGLFLAEPADEQLQPLPRCHTGSLAARAVTCVGRADDRHDDHPLRSGSGASQLADTDCRPAVRPFIDRNEEVSRVNGRPSRSDACPG